MAIVLLAVAPLFSGRLRRAPMTWDKWTHATKTLDDFDRDDYECRRDNQSTRTQVASEMRGRCMLMKGRKRT